jgi:hypothetical protein
MTGIADCCARAESGHIAATLPKEQMNSRRLMAASGAQRTGIDTIALRKGLAKSAMGQKQTFVGVNGMSALPLKADIRGAK